MFLLSTILLIANNALASTQVVDPKELVSVLGSDFSAGMGRFNGVTVPIAFRSFDRGTADPLTQLANRIAGKRTVIVTQTPTGSAMIISNVKSKTCALCLVPNAVNEAAILASTTVLSSIALPDGLTLAIATPASVLLAIPASQTLPYEGKLLTHSRSHLGISNQTTLLFGNRRHHQLTAAVKTSCYAFKAALQEDLAKTKFQELPSSRTLLISEAESASSLLFFSDGDRLLTIDLRHCNNHKSAEVTVYEVDVR